MASRVARLSQIPPRQIQLNSPHFRFSPAILMLELWGSWRFGLGVPTTDVSPCPFFSLEEEVSFPLPQSLFLGWLILQPTQTSEKSIFLLCGSGQHTLFSLCENSDTLSSSGAALSNTLPRQGTRKLVFDPSGPSGFNSPNIAQRHALP